MVVALQASVATGRSKLHEVPNSTVLLLLHVIVGAVVSVIVTVWLHCELLPHRSEARQVRMALNVLPQAELVRVLTMEMLLVPLLSVAVGGSKLQAVPH